jgi:hypothetical protein
VVVIKFCWELNATIQNKIVELGKDCQLAHGLVHHGVIIQLKLHCQQCLLEPP